MKNIFITAPYLHKDREWVEENIISKNLGQYEFHWVPVKERLTSEDLKAFVRDADGIICGDDAFDSDIFEIGSRLKVVVKWGTGIDSIDASAAKSHGVRVLRTPGAFTVPVAETTLGFILNHFRKIAVNQEIFRSGAWDKPAGDALAGKVAGVVGFGDIGKRVAKLLKAFDARVIVFDTRDLSATELLEAGVEFCDFKELLRAADIISLHCDLNPTSDSLINKEAFETMVRKPYLVNTARGGLIDYAALGTALAEGAISGVGLDVFDEEPLPSVHPLRRCSMVTASCHNSNSSQHHWRNVHTRSFSMLFEELAACE